ncbi:MAG TPA: fatty acid desaturase [Polyangia bacterium]|nr:fatty acid desaturase [Polyangia bacterium]
MSDASDRDNVVWDPPRSVWFGVIALIALVGAVPAFTMSAFAVFATLTGLTLCAGHSVGIHRGLIHRSYRVSPWLERLLVYLGALVGLGGPLGLVRMHQARDFQQNQPRCHDYFAHRQPWWRDYFWNLHCRFEPAVAVGPRLDEALGRDPFLRFLERTWRWQQAPLALLFFVLGGWPFLIWGVFVRVAVGTTGYWFVNFVTHRGGHRRWHNRGAAVQGWNSLLLGAISMGEGWHNNHHAFPRSARLGLRWWELDPGWWLIAGLRAAGLATNVLVAGDASRAPSAVALRAAAAPPA